MKDSEDSVSQTLWMQSKALYEAYWTKLGTLPDAYITDIAGLRGYVTFHGDPLLNGVIGDNSQISNSSVRAILDFFIEKSLPMSWRVFSRDLTASHNQALTGRGMLLVERAVCMSIELSKLKGVPCNGRLEIRQVLTQADLVSWVDVLSRSFELSAAMGQCILQAEKGRLLETDKSRTNYVGVFDHQPVSTLSMLVENGIAGLFNAGTLPGKSGLRCGPSHLMRAVEDAQILGLQSIVLHACPSVEKFCKCLGFSSHGRIDTYVATPEWLVEFERIKGVIGHVNAAP